MVGYLNHYGRDRVSLFDYYLRENASHYWVFLFQPWEHFYYLSAGQSVGCAVNSDRVDSGESVVSGDFDRTLSACWQFKNVRIPSFAWHIFVSSGIWTEITACVLNYLKTSRDNVWKGWPISWPSALYQGFDLYIFLLLLMVYKMKNLKFLFCPYISWHLSHISIP